MRGPDITKKDPMVIIVQKEDLPGVIILKNDMENSKIEDLKSSKVYQRLINCVDCPECAEILDLGQYDLDYDEIRCCHFCLCHFSLVRSD
jgi:hypothetical protein